MADEDDVIEEETEIVEGREESDKATSPVETEKSLAPQKYQVRPGLGEKFQSQNVKEIILSTMQEQLMGRQYSSDQAPRWVKAIANAVRQRVQDLDMKNYKILVQTTILERKGAGIKCAHRCVWDPETDSYTDDMYKNDTIFCYTIVYGLYVY